MASVASAVAWLARFLLAYAERQCTCIEAAAETRMTKAGKFGAQSPRLTRRDVLRTATMGAVAAGFASPAIAQQRNVSFTLPWVPEGPNLITFVAKANGYWSK